MPLWVFPTNSPVRLGVSPSATTPTDFYTQRCWGFLFLPQRDRGLRGLLHTNVGPPGLSTTDLPTPVCQLPCCPPCPPATALPGILSTLTTGLYPSYQVWMNVSFLTPWLSDFHTVWFSGSSGCFFVFKFVFALLVVVQGGQWYLPMLLPWPEFR